MLSTSLRPDLPELPERMRSLPTSRGYPVPFFVAWVNGEADFRVFDGEKLHACVLFDLCWLCGQKLGTWKTFVVGPMCIINRTSSEPPSHKDCAIFAAKACPFLTRPKARRREADLPEGRKDPAGEMCGRNPGCIVVWTTRKVGMFSDGKGGRLFELGDPTETLWFTEGRPSTREEVDTSINTGLPFLMELAEQDGQGAVAELHRLVKRAEQYLLEAAP